MCDQAYNAGETVCWNPVCRMAPGDRWFDWNYAIAMRTTWLKNAINSYKYSNQRHWAAIFGRILVGFLTYYAVRGINYRVRALPQYDSLDVAYLGTVMLDLAGLPLSDSHRERKRLMAACRGRYYSCANRDEILQFHRRLIDSGVVAAR